MGLDKNILFAEFGFTDKSRYNKMIFEYNVGGKMTAIAVIKQKSTTPIDYKIKRYEIKPEDSDKTTNSVKVIRGSVDLSQADYNAMLIASGLSQPEIDAEIFD